MLHLKAHSVVAACLFLALPLVCRPQATEVDQITGTIQDSTGGLIAKATVKATQTDTGFTRTAVTGADGSYVLRSLPIGPYRIEVSATGFKTSVQDGVVLQVNVNPTMNVTLVVGAVTQQIEVQAQASMAETETAAIGQVINSQSVDDLPLNGRNPAQLVVLSGASATIGGYIGSKNYPTSETIAVAGGDTNGTVYLMDGGYYNDVFSAVNLPLPFPDVLQEFSVQTSSIPATYGERAGGVVNVVTKSGTNAYHGDVFEFIRNGIVNAKNRFATTVDEQKRNQFGATAGGPIKHDKLFFFGGWQETILRTAPPTTISFTPTAAELSGNFSAITKPIFDPTTGLQFPGNQIPTGRFSQASLNLLKYIPVGAPGAGEVQYPIPSPSNENQYLGRIDWNQSQRDSVYGRYYYTKDSNPAQFGGDLLLTTAPGVIDTVQALTIGDTFTLSPTKLNTLHYTWTYERINRGPATGVPSAASLGLLVAPSTGNSPQISVSNYFTTMCGTCSIATVYSGTNQVADDFNLIRGRQSIVFGVDWVGKYLHYTTSSAQNAAYTFNGSLTASPSVPNSGNALADFMLGLTSSFTLGSIEQWNPVTNYFGYYISDNVKLNHRLSLNAGLRWEPYLPQHAIDNKASYFNVGAFAEGIRTSQFVNAPPGILFPGDKGLPTGALYHTLANLGPRVGLVWDVLGNAKTIVHVGYGIIDDGRNDLEAFDRYSFEPPWGNNLTLNNPTGGWANPFQAYPGGDPFPLPNPPTANAPFVSEGVYINAPLHPKPTYFQEWNLSVQQQFGANWLVTVNYVGNQGTHTWAVFQADPAQYIQGTCGTSACSTVANTNNRRIFTLLNPTAGSLISSMATVNDGGNSTYNAVIASVNRRLKSNLSLLFNYTWAHCIDESDTFVEVTPYLQNPFNLYGERGNCGSDNRQIYNLSLVAGTPHWTGNPLKRIGADWHLSLILSGHTGFWFSPATGTDASLTGVGSDRPNVTGNPNNISRSLNKWFNTADYTANPAGAYGNAGRNSLLGPGGYEPDMAVYRDFPYELFHKSQLFNVRFESFNVLNHPTFANPTATFTSSNFGKVLSANNPRIMQLAAKYVF